LKTAIVTGAAGFIGSHLSEKLLENGFKVIGIDCFTDYYSKEIKKNNMISFQNNKNFKLIENDLMKIDLTSIIKESEFLFHEAGQPGVRASWGEQFDTYVKDNILVTQKILESAKEVKTLEKIVMASSSSIYGEQEGIMIENKTIPSPISPYGVTKLASENLGLTYALNYDLPITSLRYFTVYGPRQRPDMAFTKFIKANLSGDKISIFGDGNQIRDFTFISDIIDANLKCMESDIHGNVLNIGGGKTYSIIEVLKKIENITGEKNKISFTGKQKGDVKRTEANIENAIRTIHYSPKITLNDGLEKQILWIKDILEKNELRI
jgi:nucleoside-diphosphate-sugar epimerase